MAVILCGYFPSLMMSEMSSGSLRSTLRSLENLSDWIS